MKRIGYSKLHRMGKMGNQLFEIASLWGIGRRLGRTPELPEKWMYQDWFEYQFKIGERLPFDKDFCEGSYEFCGWEYWENMPKDDMVSISGWLQSSKNWEEDREFARQLFTFKESFRAPIDQKYHDFFNMDREVIAITVRVGQDYKDNGNYEILPISYYLGALYDKFPYWKDYNILVFSDDSAYCKLNFTHENMLVVEGRDVEQLYLATKCKHWILANSTFSWWAAYLGESENSKIVYPDKYFKNMLVDTDLKDFWLEHWEPFQHDYKIDFKDVTFTIPVTLDHADRMENFNMCVAYLQKHLDTNIIIGEEFGNRMVAKNTKHIRFSNNEFHRTKMLNDMANEADTPYVVNIDADVFIPLLQMCLAHDLLKQGSSMVYPYDGRFARVERVIYKDLFAKELDCGYFKRDREFKGTRSIDPPSFGGCVFWNKEDFIYGGMENENMINYGPEDYERYHRFTNLGYKVDRINGIIYHMDHWVGPNSGGGGNPHFDPNHKEYDRIKLMGNEELLEEINKWPWVNKYLAGYYEDITEGSITSAKKTFQILKENFDFLMPRIQSIIDVGCGVGGWYLGIGNEYDYYGIDYKVPRHKLRIPRYRYAEYNLTSLERFPFDRKFDMAMCMEVAEHLPEEYASDLVKLLCSLSDTILFSAAIPHQGGNNHYNEQWQSYWAELFRQNGAGHGVPLRKWLKDEEDIEPWYVQNSVLYQKGTGITTMVEDFVLPKMYMNIIGTLTNWA